MIEQWVEALSSLIQNKIWFAPLLVIFAGILTSVTPCSLTSVPLIIGYISGTGDDSTKKAFRLSLMFSLGMAATYITLGFFASLLGKLLHNLGPWWHFALGFIMILMALQVLGLFNFFHFAVSTPRNKRKGYIGAFLTGLLGGLFASHCALPVLIVLLAFVAESESIVWGLLLLLLYAAGHSIIILIAGTSVGIINGMTGNRRYMSALKIIKYVIGSIIILLGIYMFYLGISPDIH